MKGCYHVASPFFIENTIRDGQKEVVEPALKGTQHALDAVKICETVKAVVLTSSVAAIFGDNADVMEMKQKTLSAEHSNTKSSLKYNTYPYSKTVAEKEAWKLVTINSGLVLGSSGRGKSHSFVEVACILRSITHSSRIPMHRLFNFLVHMSGPVLGLSQKWLKLNLGIPFDIDNSPSVDGLKIVYRLLEEILKDHHSSWKKAQS